MDFIVGDMKIAIEAKSSHRIHSDHLKGLKELAREHPKVGKRLLVCTSSERRSTEDDIQIIPAVRHQLQNLLRICGVENCFEK